MMNQQLMMLEVKRYFPYAVYINSGDPVLDDEISLTCALHIQVHSGDYGLGKIMADDSYCMWYYADFASCLELAIRLDR